MLQRPYTAQMIITKSLCIILNSASIGYQKHRESLEIRSLAFFFIPFLFFEYFAKNNLK